MQGVGADTQRADTPPAWAFEGAGTGGGWAYLPSVSMITFLPLLLTWSQFVVITLRGKGSGTRESCTSATTARVRQRAVPSERTQTLPSAFASYAGWLGTTAGS